MTTKLVDLNVFVGKDFDMEGNLIELFREDHPWGLLPYQLTERDVARNQGEIIRPRLNKEQVLLDYSWLPDGVVWECRTGYGDNPIWSSEEVKENAKYGYIQWINAIGLHPDYADQAEEWGYPVVEL